MSAYLPFIIPVLTFFLGSALTLAIKRQDRAIGSIGTYAKDLSDCATEWYNQLYELDRALELSDVTFEEAWKKANFYGRNRLVLPKFLRALEVLKRHPSARELVAEAEAILHLLTSSYVWRGRNMYFCAMCRLVWDGPNSKHIPVLVPSIFDAPSEIRSEIPKLLLREKRPLSEVIPVLDGHVQAVNMEAGKLV